MSLYVRSALRDCNVPVNWYNIVGFRCVRSL
jgi:formylglycine-generating enzyme required for sulfatase activity